MIYLYFLVLVVSFAVLFKCADFVVDGATGVARVMNIPKMVVGLVLVSLATTAPEFGVSVQAAYLGHPEISLGNAIGSVLCDDGLALPLAAIIAPSAILINCRILKLVGPFLIGVSLLAYLLAMTGTIGRLDGFILVFIIAVYFVFMVRYGRLYYKEYRENREPEDKKESLLSSRWKELRRHLLIFGGGIIGVFIVSRAVIWSSIHIALYFSVSETVIGLTVVAIGTSLPEISTCITAAVKGEGEIAVGDIIGADILNILWVIGASALVNPITVEPKVINFTFPIMIVMVVAMIVSMRIGCRLTKGKGILLFAIYAVYFVLTIRFFFTGS